MTAQHGLTPSDRDAKPPGQTEQRAHPLAAIMTLTVPVLDAAVDNVSSPSGRCWRSRRCPPTAGPVQAALPEVQLGVLAVLRGSLDEARGLLKEALDLSLAVRNTGSHVR